MAVKIDDCIYHFTQEQKSVIHALIDQAQKPKIDTTNCPNCGAPVDLTENRCPYCETPYTTLNSKPSEDKRRMAELRRLEIERELARAKLGCLTSVVKTNDSYTEALSAMRRYADSTVRFERR